MFVRARGGLGADSIRDDRIQDAVQLWPIAEATMKEFKLYQPVFVRAETLEEAIDKCERELGQDGSDLSYTSPIPAIYFDERQPLITPGWYFWKFVHNLLIHPLLALPWEPKWAQRAHDWTAQRCGGGG